MDLSFGDLNIYEPTFDQKEYSFEVTGAELIGQLRAQDRDPGDSISYRLLNFERLAKFALNLFNRCYCSFHPTSNCASRFPALSVLEPSSKLVRPVD